jgi:4-diphosphocytidyl-2-C-methyl-D-erythritol kinase
VRQKLDPAASVRLRSLAKINLDLRVLDKRPDGYHNLRTVFQTVGLADVIEIDYEPARRLILHLDSNPPIPGNLIEKAAELLAIPGRFTIRLTKRIPMGAGLGGGSSNAAAILLAIPALTGKNLPLEKLTTLGAQLGSDVPFFLLGGTALGLGRGTELHPLPDWKPFPAIIVTPGIHVSTADAYRVLDDERATSNDERPQNSFEPVVFRQHPQLKSIKGRLLKLGADLALMSGSGSALFGIFAHREKRDSAVVSLREDFGYHRIFPVWLVGRSVYRSLWRRQLRDAGDLKTWPPQNRYAR